MRNSARTLSTLAGLALLVTPLLAQANPPSTLPFQARLSLQANGADVNALQQFEFAIYSVTSGGTALWTETHPLVMVRNGLFKVELGSVQAFPVSLFASGDLYLGVKVGADQEMVPRTKLTSQAFAQLAKNAVDVKDSDINPRSITVNGVPVIDQYGQWVGSPSGLAGPQGPAGATGATGATGPQGDVGPAGPQGDVGPAGPQGDVGPAGPQGDAGPAGPQGDVGPAGPQGDVGPAGPQGDVGPAGPQGDVGAAGPQGDVGAAGPQGDVGSVGPQGDIGPAGPKGDAGPAGPQGDVGPAGPKGDAGPAGPQGDAGPAGPQGDAGPAGAQGDACLLYTSPSPRDS